MRSYNVYAGSMAVLEIEGRPGRLMSMASLPEGMAPPEHRFLHGVSRDWQHENALAQLLAVSTDFDDFVRRLVDAGYDLMSGQVLSNVVWESARRIFRGDQLAGAAWPATGHFATLWWQPEGDAEGFPHASLTAYRHEDEGALQAALRATASWDDLTAALARAGYRVSES